MPIIYPRSTTDKQVAGYLSLELGGRAEKFGSAMVGFHGPPRATFSSATWRAFSRGSVFQVVVTLLLLLPVSRTLYPKFLDKN